MKTTTTTTSRKKLDVEDVRIMRKYYGPGCGLTQQEVSVVFGIARSQVSRILSCISWREVKVE